MTHHQRISIQFCGGCNPRIDRGKVATQVMNLLKNQDYEICYNSLDVDFVIYLSGCTANCALRYKTSHLPSVVVAAATLDTLVMEEKQLAMEIVMKVRAYFESLASKLST